jgi:hypothetical protein
MGEGLQNGFVNMHLITATILTKCQDETGLFVQPRIILAQLFEAVSESVFVEPILGCVALLLPSGLQLFESGKGAPEGGLCF